MRSIRRALAGLVLFLLVMQGCKMGPNYQRSDTGVDSTMVYRFDELRQDTIINIAWWDQFQDPQLQELIEIALVENQDVRIAAARIEEARAFLGFTRADLYPAVSISAQGTRNNFLSTINQQVDARNTFFAAPALNWEIDFWGKLRRAKEAAAAEMLATEYGRRAVQVALISEVAATYFLLLDFDQRLDIASRTLESRRSSTALIQERFDQGYTAQIDLDQASIQEYIAEAAVPFYERLVAQTENRLSVLLGRPPGSVPRGLDLYAQPLPPEVPPGIPSALMERRPDVMRSEQLVVAQNARIGIAKGAMFPSISLTGFLGTASNELDQLFADGSAVWSFGGSLVGPLFNMGKNRRRVEIERQRTEQARLDYQATVLQAFREVEDALIGVDTYKRELDARLKQRESAISAKGLSLERYDGGVTSYLEVLENDRTLFQTELETAQTQQLYLMAYVSLYKALGGGWITREEQEAAANQE